MTRLVGFGLGALVLAAVGAEVVVSSPNDNASSSPPPAYAPPAASSTTQQPECSPPENVGNGVINCHPKTAGQCPTGYTPNADGGVVCVKYSSTTQQQPNSPPPTLDCGRVGPAVGTYNPDKNDCTYRWPSGFTSDSPAGATLQSYQTGGIGVNGYRACDVLYWSNGTTTHAC